MSFFSNQDPVVVTGIGMVTALGLDRESTWQGIVAGKCGIGPFVSGRPVPDDIKIAAQVDLPATGACRNRLNAIRFAECAFTEAIEDSKLNLASMDPAQIGISSAAHMGDVRPYYLDDDCGESEQAVAWWQQWLPSSVVDYLALKWAQEKQVYFRGPKLCFSTACASSMISMIQAIRAIRRRECDVMIAGGSEGIDDLFASGFSCMRALSRESDPRQGCRPFDIDRTGFVMGEGASFLVFERQSHAVARGAKIYATILSESLASQAHHITGVDMEDEALIYLINNTVQKSGLDLTDFHYVNAHGTGTEQNDIVEINCINSVFRSHAEQLRVSSTKSQIGHLVNASGCTELAITILGLRDGISPPTVNLHRPESACRFDCVANRSQAIKAKNALKLSMAFGGHLAGIAVQRFESMAHGFDYPTRRHAA